jgi:riboflavin synthase
MFTGIVERVGTVIAVDDAGGLRRLTIEVGEAGEAVEVGDSIAVNGVCLTAVAADAGRLAVEAVPETLDRSNLGRLTAGDPVDLERPVPAGGRLDGHVVQGHVDGVGTVRSITAEGGSHRVWVDAPGRLHRYFVEKGSVAVDGVSLTVSAVDADGFEVVLIPHTMAATVFGVRRTGDAVNLEVDILAKYVERLLEAHR